jgi:S1-C subfamily serine protease
MEDGGSGTVVYSARDNTGRVETLVMTNYHIVQNGITIEEKWVPHLGKKVEKESKMTVSVETFKYNGYSRCIGSNSVEADIVAYNEEEDMAMLRTRDSETPAQYVANVFPIEHISDVCVSDAVYNCGAAMFHAPIMTPGEIVFMDDEIDNLKYWLVTAATTHGNSGGSTLRWSESRSRWEYMGIPSMVQYQPDGVGIVTHMGYIIPVDRIYRFWDDNCYQYIHDRTADIQKCNEDREKNKKQKRS